MFGRTCGAIAFEMLRDLTSPIGDCNAGQIAKHAHCVTDTSRGNAFAEQLAQIGAKKEHPNYIVSGSSREQGAVVRASGNSSLSLSPEYDATGALPSLSGLIGAGISAMHAGFVNVFSNGSNAESEQRAPLKPAGSSRPHHKGGAAPTAQSQRHRPSPPAASDPG